MKTRGLSREERALRRVMLFWGGLFALAWAGFLVPALTQKEDRRRLDVFVPLNLLAGNAMPRRKRVSGRANDREDFWLVLAMSNMALVTLFAYAVAASPRRFKHLSLPLLASKVNSALLYLLFYLKTGKPHYLAGFFFDATPFVTIIQAYAKAL
ncbi:MAG: hypothetical protein AB1742_11095 [bacterium]